MVLLNCLVNITVIDQCLRQIQAGDFIAWSRLYRLAAIIQRLRKSPSLPKKFAQITQNNWVGWLKSLRFFHQR
jgi:hypothetical protein